MKRYAIIPAVLAVLAGCQASQTSETARMEAHRRWRVVRAGVLCGVAEEHLQVGQLDAAAAKASQAVDLNEDCNKARLLLGRTHIEKGNYRMAVSVLKDALAREPRSAAAFFLLGVAQERSKRLNEALESYREAFHLDESNLGSIVAAAEVLVALGRTREAQLHVESYLPRADNEPGMFEMAGRLATMRGELDQAVSYYQQACDLDPQNVRYREMLARAAFSAGQYVEARTVLEALTARDDGEAPAWAYMLLGDCCLATNRLLRARDAYWKASELKPEDPGCWANLAKVSLLLGDVRRAAAAGEYALNLRPDHLGAALVLGYAWLRAGQGAQAVALLSQAAATHPDSGTLRCLLGRAHAAAGYPAEAARCYAEALRREPNNELARRLLNAAGGKEPSEAG